MQATVSQEQNWSPERMAYMQSISSTNDVWLGPNTMNLLFYLMYVNRRSQSTIRHMLECQQHLSFVLQAVLLFRPCTWILFHLFNFVMFCLLFWLRLSGAVPMEEVNVAWVTQGKHQMTYLQWKQKLLSLLQSSQRSKISYGSWQV